MSGSGSAADAGGSGRGGLDGPALQLGDALPAFGGEAHTGEHVDVHAYQGSGFLVVYTFPESWTPICATEIGEIVKRIDEFTARNTKVLGVSIGPAELHRRFADDIAETVGGVVPTPILADVDGAMCRRLGSVHPSLPGTGGGAHSVRSVLIFAPPDGGERDYEDVMAGDAPGSQGDADADGDADAHRRRRRRPRNWGSRALVLAMHYPPTVGRSWTEVVRAIDSLRTSEAEPSVGTPAGWVAGEDVVVLPTVSDDEARARLPGGFRSVRPYLRLAPDPTQ